VISYIYYGILLNETRHEIYQQQQQKKKEKKKSILGFIIKVREFN